eukprot:331306_1
MLLFRSKKLFTQSLSFTKLTLYPVISRSKHLESNSVVPNGTGDRLLKLMDFMAPQPAGLFSQLFNARIAFHDLFETIPTYKDTDTQLSYTEARKLWKASDFILNWVLLRSYIAGADGLSDLELNALIEEVQIWDPHTTKEIYIEAAKDGESCTDDELHTLCYDIAKTFSMEQRHALLVNALSAARIDGLSDAEIDSYYKVAKYLNVDDDSAKEVMDVYEMEVDLKERYSNLVLPNVQEK